MARGYQGPSLGLERGEGDLSKLDEINKVRRVPRKPLSGSRIKHDSNSVIFERRRSSWEKIKFQKKELEGNEEEIIKVK